jgi:hypothetical protein
LKKIEFLNDFSLNGVPIKKGTIQEIHGKFKQKDINSVTATTLVKRGVAKWVTDEPEATKSKPADNRQSKK